MATGDRDSSITRVGLVSDTHGWLDPRVADAFHREGRLDRIVHAGDIGAGPDVLYELGSMAPVTAVLGNCDFRIPGFDLGARASVVVARCLIGVVHDPSFAEAEFEDFDVVVHGHTHRPRIEWLDGTLLVNPGSATQRRNELSCSIGILEIDGEGEPTARILYLDDVGPCLR